LLLRDYVAGLTSVINEYSGASLIAATQLIADYRTDKIGLVEGRLVFIDQSELHFTEYLDVRYTVRKLSYSYHYQRKGGELLFRYDNAQHRPLLPYDNHKHLDSGRVVRSDTPQLSSVLEEIMEHLL
jgi:hypothetical protein